MSHTKLLPHHSIRYGATAVKEEDNENGYQRLSNVDRNKTRPA